MRESITRGTMIEYGEQYSSLEFAEPQEAADAQVRRDALWLELARAGRVGFSGTKADVTSLAPGCRLCAAGKWSCLFVNSICNGSCVYCPAPQVERGVPGTNLLRFPDPDDYAEYVDRFGIEGVSVSGGEPLLTLDRTLRYLGAVKRRLGSRVHTWLYTNGMRATAETIERLRDAGLDEIRFDIGATDYDTSAAQRAAGRIRTVVVEIPLLPERRDQVLDLIPRLAEIGVDHLNLHQLRITPHNTRRLTGRGYRLSRGEKVTVIDSELAVLELIAELRSRGNEFPVNYCSSVYKLRYQRMGHRRRAAAVIARADETVSDSGFLRSERGYSEAVVRESPTYRWPFTEVRFASGRAIVVERRDVDPAVIADGRAERVATGLPEYF